MKLLFYINLNFNKRKIKRKNPGRFVLKHIQIMIRQVMTEFSILHHIKFKPISTQKSSAAVFYESMSCVPKENFY